MFGKKDDEPDALITVFTSDIYNELRGAWGDLNLMQNTHRKSYGVYKVHSLKIPIPADGPEHLTPIYVGLRSDTNYKDSEGGPELIRYDLEVGYRGTEGSPIKGDMFTKTIKRQPIMYNTTWDGDSFASCLLYGENIKIGIKDILENETFDIEVVDDL